MFHFFSQVEQQISHKFKVKMLRAENVTKGPLGDLCKFKISSYLFHGVLTENRGTWPHKTQVCRALLQDHQLATNFT